MTDDRAERAAAFRPMRLRLSRTALLSNWRWIASLSDSAACGAAVKADGYGLGARKVVEVLANAGCRDFFVATWAEAADIADIAPPASISVLHGIRPADMAMATALSAVARPVLNTLEQVNLWADQGGGRSCDVMIDTGINRLGLSPDDASRLPQAALSVDILMTHLASADADLAQNDQQLACFRSVAGGIAHRRASIANSAGALLGSAYHADLMRPGLALYGGVPRTEARGHIGQVATPQAEVLQVRRISAGQPVGYNATWVAPHDVDIATINLGYADGYLRAFSDAGMAYVGGATAPVVGRVSMDLVTLALPAGHAIRAGDWVDLAYELPSAAAVSGLSQYELLTGLGQRFDRYWVD